ncbi:hypothetical protein EG68_09124 [Paragonimus skrjabini miyazakii]|uniref:Uncharacterized protein n=1 Tax=Paragonimus skrjabini miyazakii TaxID=59628 RepID=A0A8S9YLM9_9TREM|nr:hypothetical protein EG68_09124 [Paragonimus skrjabini miyazakii]
MGEPVIFEQSATVVFCVLTETQEEENRKHSLKIAKPGKSLAAKLFRRPDTLIRVGQPASLEKIHNED